MNCVQSIINIFMTNKQSTHILQSAINCSLKQPLEGLCGWTHPWRWRVRGDALVASWLCCLSLERGCWDVGWGWDACFAAGVFTWTHKRNTTSSLQIHTAYCVQLYIRVCFIHPQHASGRKSMRPDLPPLFEQISHFSQQRDSACSTIQYCF